MADEVIDVLKRIWDESICQDYTNGLIASESSLLAAFYHHARIALAEKRYPETYVVHAEPTFWWNSTGSHLERAESSRYSFPDLLIGQRIGNSWRAAAVIEFKYKPFHYPNFREDIDKLARIAGSETACGAMIDPKTGTEYPPKDLHHLEVDDSSLLIYAVIGKFDCAACDRAEINKAALFDPGRFHHFIGTVGAGLNPSFQSTHHE